MILLTDGDSWTWGSEISSPHMLNIQDPEGFASPNRFKPGYMDCHPENDEYRISRIWPTKLANILGYENVNLAWPARSNDSIVQCSTAWILKYLNNGSDPSELVAVIGWTSPERKNIIIESNNGDVYYQTFWPAMKESTFYQTIEAKKYFEFYITHLFLEIEYLERFITHCFNMHTFLKSHNIKHLFFNAFFQYRKEFFDDYSPQSIISLVNDMIQLDNHRGGKVRGWEEGTYLFRDRIDHLKNMWDSIDAKNFLHKDTFKSFKAVIHEQAPRNIVMNNWHPSPIGHTMFSEYLKPYIENL